MIGKIDVTSGGRCNIVVDVAMTYTGRYWPRQGDGKLRRWYMYKGKERSIQG